MSSACSPLQRDAVCDGVWWLAKHRESWLVADDYSKRRRLFEEDRGGLAFREVFTSTPEGPLPPRPHRSGKGGPSINQGGTQPPVTSVWSASDAAANAMTLSNGGLTFTNNGVVNKTVRGTISKTSGKLYVEFLATATGTNVAFGVASAGFNSGGFLGSSNYSAGIFYSSNQLSAGFTENLTTVGFVTTGGVIGLAVDFAAGSIWISFNNNWHGTLLKDPASGANPLISFTPATVGALFPGITPTGAGETWTLQATAASQKYAPPAGFSAWG